MCREFLMVMRECRHKFVTSSAILKEWTSHESNFGRQWRVEMARRGLESRLRIDPHQADLRNRLEKSAGSKAMLKDCHLIEGAIEADGLVTSTDEECRLLFATASSTAPYLGGIVWVNPEKPDERPIEWLRKDAPGEAHRKLAQYRGRPSDRD